MASPPSSAAGATTPPSPLISSPPLPFPPPRFLNARRITAPVNVPDDDDDDGSNDMKEGSGGVEPVDLDRSDSVPCALRRADSMVGNVLVCYDESDGTKQPTRAYWIQRKMSKTVNGSVRIGFVLRPRAAADASSDESESSAKRTKITPEGDCSRVSALKDPHPRVQWEVTPSSERGRYETVSIKIYDKSKIESSKRERTEDPMVELSALQMVAAEEAVEDGAAEKSDCHVLGARDVLSDGRFVYGVLPYKPDGDLFHYVESNGGRLSERVARHFFGQIVKGLELLQRIGICHRNISLENVLLDGTDSFLIGSGTALRVPHLPPDGSASSEVTDARSGTSPLLIVPQGQCGHPSYMAPEILSDSEPFDGYAADLWSAGIALFHMLFGHPPFVWAAGDDPRFRTIAENGKLDSLVQRWAAESDETGLERTLSDEVVDLLQGMLRADRKSRITLREVMDHEWMSSGSKGNDRVLPPPFPPTLKNMMQF